MISKRLWVLLLVSVVVLSGCRAGSGSDKLPPGALPGLTYDTIVRRTSFGIPHIEAADYGSLGYGYGYVHAEDNLCVLAEDLLTIRGERSRFFGAGGSHLILPNGSVASNVDSDFFWTFAATDEAIAPMRLNSDPEAEAATRGFVAGYNRYVSELKAGKHPGRHASCANEAWLTEITEDDMYRRYFRLAIIASSSVFVEGIATAQPPTDGVPVDELDIDDILGLIGLAELPFPLGGELPFGSNMYALGPEATESGRSMLLGNPHFPWADTERLYLANLIMPDRQIMGASLYGVPAVLIGFNDKFAWSHTVSTAFRFSIYELTLNPANPTQYLYDNEFLDMEPTEVSIQVLQEDGSLATATRTLYRSKYGPMMTFEVDGIPVLNWGPTNAYTLRDANAENDRLINQFFRWNQAQSFEEFIELHGSVLGIPWVNTAATGPGKPAYYGDISVVPHVTDEQMITGEIGDVQACGQTSLSAIANAFSQLSPGLPVLDGSSPDCEWGSDPDAPVPGIFGTANLPKLFRDDWVHNCNDSYWLSNPDEPLTGFNRIIGNEDAARSLRTRLCMLQVLRRLDGSDGLTAEIGAPADTFDLPTLQHVTLDSAIYSAELGLDSILGSLCLSPSLLGSSGPVAVGPACAVLANWDRRGNLDSVGAHIWREFWRELGLPLLGPSPLMWTTPFSSNDPVNTPSGLNPLDPTVLLAFADGVQRVLDSPFAVDTPLGEIQQSGVHEGDRIPIFGGEDFEGAFTYVNSRDLTTGTGRPLDENGYPITYGNSYIQTVTWDANNNPIAEGFVTYSQSSDPASPYYRDMTEVYTQKQWIRFPFREAEIAADTQQTLIFRVE